MRLTSKCSAPGKHSRSRNSHGQGKANTVSGLGSSGSNLISVTDGSIFLPLSPSKGSVTVTGTWLQMTGPRATVLATGSLQSSSKDQPARYTMKKSMDYEGPTRLQKYPSRRTRTRIKLMSDTQLNLWLQIHEGSYRYALGEQRKRQNRQVKLTTIKKGLFE